MHLTYESIIRLFWKKTKTWIVFTSLSASFIWSMKWIIKSYISKKKKKKKNSCCYWNDKIIKTTLHIRIVGGTHGVMVIVVLNEHTIWVPNLDDAISISHSVNTLGERYESINSPPAMGKSLGRLCSLALNRKLAQSAGAVEYTDCISAEG